MRRRAFVTSGVSVASVLLAGCSADGASTSDGGDGSANGDGTAGSGDGADSDGRFRLLVSDQPAAIGDFDSLTVTFSHARVFGGDAVDTATGTEATATTDGGNETATTTDGGGGAQPEDDQEGNGNGQGTGRGNGDDEDAGDEAEADGDGGFTRFDLDGASVDLTQVVGDAAMPILEETLAPGRYTKIELHASDVVGMVDGEEANVHIPSGKLMITKPFEIRQGETTSFVFDINVVQRGQGNDYNLLPVIDQSGVAGEDVEAEEVDGENSDEDDGSEEADESEDDETADSTTTAE